MSNLRYTNGTYEVKYTRYPKNRPFKVQLVSDPGYHTHLRTLKEAVDAANYAKHNSVPLSGKVDYLESIQRLITNQDDIYGLEKLIEAKKHKVK